MARGIYSALGRWPEPVLPHGPAIELGNRRHVGFGVAHEDAAGAVARMLVSILEALGGVDVFWFTMD